MQPFSKKSLKRSVALVVILSLLMQLVPSPQPAEAFDLLRFVGNLFSFVKQKIPDEIKLTEKGSLMLGKTCLVGKNDACLLKSCICKEGGLCNKDEECTNPASKISFGEWKDDLFINKEGPTKGLLDIPVPKTLKECQLRVPLPPDEQEFEMTPEQKLARRKACNYLANIERSAAQLVYTAKKIFNNTDPLSDCNFLRNCRSQCNLRLGSLTYNISLSDIAKLFIPGGFLMVVANIMNVARVVMQVKDVLTTINTLIVNGIDLINNIFTITSSVASFYKSFNMLGLKISDVLLAGPMTATTLWGAGSKLLGMGVGAVGLEGPERVLKETGEFVTPDRVEKGFNKLKQILFEFSENLSAFVTAKSEALKIANQTRRDAEEIRQAFKQETPIEFLFRTENESESKKHLNQMLKDYFKVFQSIGTLLDPAIKAGTLPARGPSDIETGETSYVIDREPGEGLSSFNQKAVGFECKKINENDCQCVFERRVIPQEPKIWFQAFKESFQAAYLLHTLLEPNYIKEVIHKALDYDEETGKYNMQDLDYTKGPWVHYWERLARIFTTLAQDLDFVGTVINKAYNKVPSDKVDTKETWEETHPQMVEKVKNIYPALGILNEKLTRVDFKAANAEEQLNGALKEYQKARIGINRAFGKGLFTEQRIKDAVVDSIKTCCPPHGVCTKENYCENLYNKDPWEKYWEEIARAIKGEEFLEKNSLAHSVSESINIIPALIEIKKLEKPEQLGWFDNYKNKVLYSENAYGQSPENQGSIDWVIHKAWENFWKRATLANDMALTDALNNKIKNLWDYETNHLRPNMGERCKDEYRSNPEGEKQCRAEAEQNKELYCTNQCKGSGKDCEETCKKRFNSEKTEERRLYEWWLYECQEDWMKACKSQPTKYFKKYSVYYAGKQQCDASTIFNSKSLSNTYQDDIMFRNWEERIKIFYNLKDHLGNIKKAFSYGLDLQSPIFFYTIENTEAQLESEKIQGLNKAIKQIKDGLSCKYDDDYYNYYEKKREIEGEEKTCQDIYDDYVEKNKCSQQPKKEDKLFCDYYNQNCQQYRQGYLNYNNCKQIDKPIYEGKLNELRNELINMDLFQEIHQKAQELKNMLNELRNIWQPSDIPKNKESEIARDYVKKWVETIKKSQEIKEWVRTTTLEVNELPGDIQTILDNFTKSNPLPSSITSQYNPPVSPIESLLKEQLSEGANTFKNIVLKPLENRIGTRQTCRNDLYTQWKNNSENGFGENAFLEKVHCFESEKDDKGKNIHVVFENLNPFLDVLSSLEDVVDYLSDSISYIRELEPKIDIEPVKLNRNFANEWLSQKKESITSFWQEKRDNPDQVQIFEKSPQSFENFLTNPVGEIEKLFKNIDESLKSAQGSIDDSKYLIENTITWKNFQKQYLKQEEKEGALDKLWKKIAELKTRVAVKSQAKEGCQIVDLVLKAEPGEIEENCNNLKTNLIEDSHLKNKCDIIKATDPEITRTPESLQEEIDKAKNQVTATQKEYEEKCPGYNLINPQSIKETIHQAMNYNRNTGLYENKPETEDDDKLNYKNPKWREYWETLAKNLSEDSSWVDKCISGNNDDIPEDLKEAFDNNYSCKTMESRHKTMQDFAVLKVPALKIVAALDSSSPSFLGERKYINFYNDDKAEEELLKLLSDYERIKLGIVRTEENGLFNRETIEKTIKDSLNCQGSIQGNDLQCEMERLNYTKGEWRKYWQDLAQTIMGPEWVEEQRKKYADKEEEFHKKMLEISDAFWPLEKLKELDGEKIKDGSKAKEAINNFLSSKPKGLDPVCIQLENEIAGINERIEFLKKTLETQKNLGVSNEESLNNLLNACDEREAQLALKEECSQFDALKTAFQNNCSRALDKENKKRCKDYKPKIDALNQFCSEGLLDCSQFNNQIPDLTKNIDEIDPSKRVAVMTIKDELAKLCQTQFLDIKTPFEKVMKVFSIITSIKSGTSIFNGIKGSVTALKKIVDTAQRLKGMITETVEMVKGLLSGKDESTGLGGAASGALTGGLEITPIMCTASPAISYTKESVQTGPAGGKICPDIPSLFAQLESNFALIRTNLRKIDLTQRGIKDVDLKLGKLGIKVGELYKVRPELKVIVRPMLERAQSLKNKAQLTWALAEAVRFSSGKCTCGESYCKLPLCISGLPLTLSPVSNANCWITYIFRYPLIKLAQSLADELQTIPESE